MKKRPARRKPAARIHMSVHDVLFECPACHQSMVVDEAAINSQVLCTKCGINVIVPVPLVRQASDILLDLQENLQYANELILELKQRLT